MQSKTLFKSAARKPIVWKLSSLEVHKTSPPITGSRERTTGREVCSPRIIHENSTVTNGDEALIVLKLAAT